MFAVVSWHDSVQGLAVSRRDGVVSLEVWTHTLVTVIISPLVSHLSILTFYYRRTQRQRKKMPSVVK